MDIWDACLTAQTNVTLCNVAWSQHKKQKVKSMYYFCGNPHRLFQWEEMLRLPKTKLYKKRL